MGNSGSRPNTPGASSPHISPNAAPAKKPPKRKESVGALSAKGSAVAPTASLESATGQQANDRRGPSRGRSSTTSNADGSKTHPQDALDGLSGTTDTPNRSRSPRPPLHVETASPAPSDLDPVTRTASSSQASSDSPLPYYGPHGAYGRAPRLPLPIEEETLEPGTPGGGSPTSNAVDLTGTADGIVDDVNISKSRSVLSSTTVDEEDEIDEDTIYKAADIDGPVVDTLIEWKEGGKDVFVTGTFCHWLKKSRLFRDGPSKDTGAFSTIIGLPPGFLYLSFLVDGVARTSKYMSTTVDYAGSLVNYVQVPPEYTPQPVVPRDAGTGPLSPSTQPSQSKDRIMQPPATELRPVTSGDQSAPPTSAMPVRTPSRKQKPSTAETEIKTRQAELRKKKTDDKKYYREIPEYLLDWDAPENSSRQKRANAVSSTHQAPPQLPAYMQKSILSLVTPLKDDASVLAMPNHTVLNHLATSSIKDGVLGTSATTRYKKKFVTSILYMPTNSSGS